MLLILEINLYYQQSLPAEQIEDAEEYLAKENCSRPHTKLGLNCEQSSARATSTCGCWNRLPFQWNSVTASHISVLPNMQDTKMPQGNLSLSYLGGRK